MYLLCPFTKYFSKRIKIALKDIDFPFFSDLKFPGQTACKTCYCRTHGQLILADSSRRFFSISVLKYRKVNQQPVAPSKAKYLLTRPSYYLDKQPAALAHCFSATALCHTGSQIPLLHLQTSLSHVKHTPQLYESACEHTQFIHCVAKESSIHTYCPRAGTLQALL